ncbi:unnamed protein product [Nezara viridula]|uniref:Uncharacterized protein n=1 Tax=Nezara viridula TaxID=85310 RepID=A0A9P0MQL9_NEZVI|nr:unnamed protein product [Nezara viridula]
MGYMRGGNMEQRWQDLASLLSLPEPHYLSGYPPQEHKPTAGLPMPHQEHHAVTPYSPMGKSQFFRIEVEATRGEGREY